MINTKRVMDLLGEGADNTTSRETITREHMSNTMKSMRVMEEPEDTSTGAVVSIEVEAITGAEVKDSEVEEKKDLIEGREVETLSRADR